jgi:hypothetical protein
MQKIRFHSMVLTALACVLCTLPAAAESQARIVRLSDVQGGVTIDKNKGLGFENAFLNLPITQGTILHTRSTGRAEIEFEDGSTLRLTPNTIVEFNSLGLSAEGKRLTTVNLGKGRAYVNWLGKSGDKFSLNFSQEKVELAQPAHIRVEASASAAEIANYKSVVEVAGPAGTVKVDKKKMVAFDVNDNDRSTVAKNIPADTYDDWDKQSVEYHSEYAKNNSNNVTPYGYGVSDLNYYGSYTSFPGYGNVWQPFFAGAGWNPYMDGAWSFYPGMGYMWASAYPWGWMPYRYGNWVYSSGLGWGWQPGGFDSWHGGLQYVGAAVGFQPPLAPTGSVSTVVVGRGGPVKTVSSTGVVVTRGSAGMNIPRGSLDNLHQLNSQVTKKGSVALQAKPQFSATSARAIGPYYGEPMSASPSTGRASAAPAGHSSTPGGLHR